MNRGQSANFRRAGAGGKSGVQRVDIESEVNRTIAHLGPDFRHKRCEGFVPALLGRDYAYPKPGRPVEIIGGIAGGTQADLGHALGVDQTLFDGASERRTMGDLFAEHVFVDVGMGVDMDHSYWAMNLVHRPQDRQRNGMIAAQSQGYAVRRQYLVIGCLDDAHGLEQIERVDRHIADIRHLQRFKRCGAGRHVVGADHAGLRTDFTRPKPGAGAVGGADIHRNADKANVQPRSRGLARQTHHCDRTAKARHLIAAKRLVELAHPILVRSACRLERRCNLQRRS